MSSAGCWGGVACFGCFGGQGTATPKPRPGKTPAGKLRSKNDILTSQDGAVISDAIKALHASADALGKHPQPPPSHDLPPDDQLREALEAAQRALEAAVQHLELPQQQQTDAAGVLSTPHSLQQVQERLVQAADAGVVGASALAAATEALTDARRWLARQPGQKDAFDVLLGPGSTAGATIATFEARLLATGAAEWRHPHAALAWALLGLYADLAQQAANPRPHARPFRAAVVKALLERPEPVVLTCAAVQYACGAGKAAPPGARGAPPQMGAQAMDAVIALEVLRRLLWLALAAAQPTSAVSDGPGAEGGVGGPGSLQPCWATAVEQLQQQPSGTLHVLITRPFNMGTAPAHLAALPVLRLAYLLEAVGVLPEGLAALHVGAHWARFLSAYHAARQDPQSAAATLAGHHLAAVLAAVEAPSMGVRAALRKLQVVPILLSQFSLEAVLYSEEQARAAQRAEEDARAGSSGDDDEEEEEDAGYGRSATNSPGPCDSSGVADAAAAPAPLAGVERGSQPGLGLGGQRASVDRTSSVGKKFTFTYDLNEDFERLMEYEARTGNTVELDGFEYDDEAKALLARGVAGAPPSATSLATTVSNPAPPNGGSLPALSLPPRTGSIPSGGGDTTPGQSDRAQSTSEGDSESVAPARPASGRPSIIPKLSFNSLRSAASSRIVTPLQHSAPQQPVGSPGPRGTALRAKLSSLAAQPSIPQPDPRGSHATLPSQPSTARSSGRLYHSHLSPLSARAEATPGAPLPSVRAAAAPSTVVFNIPDPTRPAPPEIMQASLPGPSDRVSPFMKHPHPPADWEVRTAGDVPGRSAHAPLQGNGDQLVAQAVCDSGVPHADASLGLLMCSESRDAVPDLMPRPPPPRPSNPVPWQGGGGSGTGGGPPPPMWQGSQDSSPSEAARVPSLDLGAMPARDGNVGGGAADPAHEGALGSGSTMHDSAMNPGHLPPASSERHGRMLTPQDASPPAAAAVTQSLVREPYDAAVQSRLWFHDPALHTAMLRLLLRLLLGPGGVGGLDPEHAQPFPADAGAPNTEHVLTWHFAAPTGSGVLPDLAATLSGPAAAAVDAGCLRLLRLVSRQLFDPAKYVDLAFHSRGAYGVVYRAKQVVDGVTRHVMIKTIELPANGFDRCVLPDVYGEVTILERYALAAAGPAGLRVPERGPAPGAAPLAGVCQLLDYGLTRGAYWIVMQRYACSLADWRARQPPVSAASPAAAALYLAVLDAIAATLEVLNRDAVAHFDLKATNVLVQPLPGVRDGQLYGPPPPPPCTPLFQPVLADFGEARRYQNADEAYTARNRGTEVYKSPEMLLMGSMTPSAHAAAGRGAGLASDVWSFGCLAYELLAGRSLFTEADYASVTHRVAFGPGPALELSRGEVAALGPLGEAPLAPLVQSMLVRDPAKRPGWALVRDALSAARAQALAHVQPA